MTSGGITLTGLFSFCTIRRTCDRELKTLTYNNWCYEEEVTVSNCRCLYNWSTCVCFLCFTSCAPITRANVQSLKRVSVIAVISPPLWMIPILFKTHHTNWNMESLLTHTHVKFIRLLNILLNLSCNVYVRWHVRYKTQDISNFFNYK